MKNYNNNNGGYNNGGYNRFNGNQNQQPLETTTVTVEPEMAIEPETTTTTSTRGSKLKQGAKYGAAALAGVFIGWVGHKIYQKKNDRLEKSLQAEEAEFDEVDNLQK